jgi:hypothetical protein
MEIPMTHQSDADGRLRQEVARRDDRIDKSSRAIFVILALLIVIGAGAYFYGASHVEINPGKSAGDKPTTLSTPAPTPDQR